MVGMRAFRVLSALTALCACATPLNAPKSASEGEIIRATGKAEIDVRAPESAKRRALEDAERRAIEETLSLHMPHDLLVRNADALQSHFLDHPKIFIRRRKVIKTWKEPAYVKTEIEARVDFAAIEHQLLKMGLAKSIEAGPHARIVLSGLDACADLEGFEKILEAAPGVGDYFVERCGGGRALLWAVVNEGLSSRQLAADLSQQAGLAARVGPEEDTLSVDLKAPAAEPAP